MSTSPSPLLALTPLRAGVHLRVLLLLLVLLLVVPWLRVLELVPVYDGPPGVLHHLHPVLLLQLLPVLAESHLPGNDNYNNDNDNNDNDNDNEIHLPDGVRPAEHVVVQDGQLEIDLQMLNSNLSVVFQENSVI